MASATSFRSIDGESVLLRLGVPKTLRRFVVRKGSLCVDGVSLDVNRAARGNAEINLIPHTLEGHHAVAPCAWAPGSTWRLIWVAR
jgi:riboflavin synthase